MQESTKTNIAFDEQREQAFQETLAKYPNKMAALLPTLWLAMDQFKYLSLDVLEYIAGRLELSPVHVYSVAEFYTMYKLEPVGKYHLQLCRNLSCSLLGAENIISLLEEKYGIHPEQVTDDGTFSLELVECLGSCGTAPVMRVNDTYYENLTLDRVANIIAACRDGRMTDAGRVKE